jgi:hypothetical protein
MTKKSVRIAEKEIREELRARTGSYSSDGDGYKKARFSFDYANRVPKDATPKRIARGRDCF